MGAVILNAFSQVLSYGSRRHMDPNEGATCAWIAADEAVGCTSAFLMKRRSSRRLICRGRSGSGLRENDNAPIPWSQHFLTTQSERYD
ncbi:uncharacterized protein TNCV_1762201 [Trichonephila clavipes]|nr:uncharacterized protein TNCV_1762201 [Trichonephila clavipes]